jgi:hypothetical protein
MTAELRVRIIEMKEADPHLSHAEIGRRLNLNPGRVSETLKFEPLLPEPVQSYLDTAEADLRPLLTDKNIKTASAAAAFSLQFLADGLNVMSLTDLLSKTAEKTILKDIGLASLGDIATATGVGFNLPDFDFSDRPIFSPASPR